jgi:F0F1-type ATP synthase membrane subunit c/vacuolar-type H+-ATPase subunit K
MTAGSGVEVAVSGMDVGNGAYVGAAVGAGAQAVIRNRSTKEKHTRFFILNSFPMLNVFV